jgi:hypothetical protein
MKNKPQADQSPTDSTIQTNTSSIKRHSVTINKQPSACKRMHNIFGLQTDANYLQPANKCTESLACKRRHDSIHAATFPIKISRLQYMATKQHPFTINQKLWPANEDTTTFTRPKQPSTKESSTSKRMHITFDLPTDTHHLRPPGKTNTISLPKIHASTPPPMFHILTLRIFFSRPQLTRLSSLLYIVTYRFLTKILTATTLAFVTPLASHNLRPANGCTVIFPAAISPQRTIIRTPSPHDYIPSARSYSLRNHHLPSGTSGHHPLNLITPL